MATKRPLFLLLLLLAPLVLARRWPSFKARRTQGNRSRPVSADGSADDSAGQKLMLSPYLADGRIDEARNLSRVVGAPFPEDVPSYSGFFTVNSEYDSNMFFWFFPAEHDYENAPVLLWLNGGPGVTSILGLFTEVGPFFIAHDNRSLVENPYSWHKNHSLIFIDNPVGVGFSYTNSELGYATKQEDVDRDLYNAVIQFFTLFPELQKNNFFMAGESYAGKYIPALGHTIHEKNKNASIHINLKGMAIGDGYVDPVNMIRHSDLVYQWGLVDNATWKAMQVLEDAAVNLVAAGNFAAANNISEEAEILYELTSGINVYNILKPFTLDEPYLEFLDMDSVRFALHVSNQIFVENSQVVYEHLYAEVMKSVTHLVEDLLNSGYRMVFYNGQLDIDCAYTLTVKMLEALQFNGSEQYKTARRNYWYVDGRLAGYTKTAGNMTEVMVRNAGHMVPEDQPAAAFDLIYRITRNIPL